MISDGKKLSYDFLIIKLTYIMFLFTGRYVALSTATVPSYRLLHRPRFPGKTLCLGTSVFVDRSEGTVGRAAQRPVKLKSLLLKISHHRVKV